MPDEIQEKSQVEGEAKVVEAGAETPQSTEPTVTEQPGAETVSQEAPVAPKVEVASPKTYTEEEVKQREAQITSKLQAETAQAREHASKLALAQQVQALAQAEQQAQSKDQQEVTNGVITENEAAQRRDQRIHALQSQAQSARMQQALQAQAAQGEQLGRVLMAQDVAKEYGVDADVLLKDTTITTPLQMVQKAAKLALKARDAQLRALSAKPETFDKGPQTETTGPETYEQSLKARYPTMYKEK